MAKRSYNRRSDDELIEDLQDRIKKIENRLEARQRPDARILKEIPKLKRTLARFAQLCMDHQRNDISNSIVAFMATVEHQARHAPETQARSRSSAGQEVRAS